MFLEGAVLSHQNMKSTQAWQSSNTWIQLPPGNLGFQTGGSTSSFSGNWAETLHTDCTAKGKDELGFRTTRMQVPLKGRTFCLKCRCPRGGALAWAWERTESKKQPFLPCSLLTASTPSLALCRSQVAGKGNTGPRWETGASEIHLPHQCNLE